MTSWREEGIEEGIGGDGEGEGGEGTERVSTSNERVGRRNESSSPLLSFESFHRYIRDKRSSARTTKHIDRKLTFLERNVAGQSSPHSFYTHPSLSLARCRHPPSPSSPPSFLPSPDLGLHESFDAARKKDGKLGNGPLIEFGRLDEELRREGERGLPVYSEKGNV